MPEIVEIDTTTLHIVEHGECIAIVPWPGSRCEQMALARRLVEGLRDELKSEGMVEQLDAYDAVLLGDGGGGDVAWWHDYIRVELARAHEFYNGQLEALQSQSSLMEEVREGAHEALEIAADLITNMFKNGAAHNMDNSCENAGSKYGSYYIGEGILPKICAAREALAKLGERT